MKPITWFLLGFTLILLIGAASAHAGWTLGDGFCYSTKEETVEPFRRTFPKVFGAGSLYVHSLGACSQTSTYLQCEDLGFAGTVSGTYRYYFTSCTQSEVDIPFEKYWIAPAVLLMFAIGWKLGMHR